MKAALIPPIPALKRFGQGDFHLLLSHLLEDERYLNHYREQRGKGAYLVLDNSAHEHGAGEGAAQLAEWARILAAQEVVVPDVLEDAGATVEGTISAFEAWYEGDDRSMTVLDPALMYVPQGAVASDWRWCLRELVELHLFNSKRRKLRQDFVIGVSKDYEVWDGGLMQLLQDDLYPLRSQLRVSGVRMQVHLLGWGRQLWNLEELARQCPWVRSTDSAKPFVYALKKINLWEHTTKDPPKYPTRPSKYFATKLTEEQEITSVKNSMLFRAMASGHLGNTVIV